MAHVATNGFLASVLSDAKGTFVGAENTFRRYQATVHTSCTLRGNRDTRFSVITYEVGRVFINHKEVFAKIPPNILRVECAYKSSSVLSEVFVGLAKKYTNFSATFEYSSLAAVAERLARGLAACSLYGDIASSDLRGGNPLRIQALGTYDGPVNSLNSCVFIPRLVDSAVGADVFSVLANAVCGEGGSVATDVLELDASNRKPIISTIDGTSLAQAIVEALRAVGANMLACDQGPLFAYAVTRGIHAVVSVVGHTDEGGIVRDLLRCGRFGVPFGGIHCGLEPYAGIPALATNGISDVCAYVDSLALVTAGLVAHCDPGTKVNNQWFPTSYDGTTSASVESAPGTHLDPTDEMATRNRAQLLANITPFLFRYTEALGKVFGAAGDAGFASAVATSQCAALGQVSRHLRYPSVCPFFWVEPTSLIPHDFLKSEAELFGCGALSSVHEPRTRLAWEDIRPSGPGDTAASGYIVKCRSARTSWFLAHWNGHPDNGLSCVSVRQMDPNGIVHPGASPIGDVRARVESGAPLSSYLWTRGQSPFCAPGEFINLNGLMGVYVNHCTFDRDGFPTKEHVPSALEFADCTVEVHVGRPRGTQSGKANSAPRDVQRARTRATRELASAAERVRIFGRPDVAAMAISTSTPAAFPTDTPRLPLDTRDHAEASGVTGWSRGSAGGPDKSEVTREAEGEAVDVTAHHQSVKFPGASKTLASGPGGGVKAVEEPPASDDDVPVAPVSAAQLIGPAQQ
ncbi:MAG: coat protein [Hangzhou totivirus 4]|nr:MAG: coat protein [Hangzhou totivirus 4]